MAGKTTPAKKAAAAARKAAAEARKKAVAAAAAKRFALGAGRAQPVGRWMGRKALVGTGGGMAGYKQGCSVGGAYHKPDRGLPAAAAGAGFAPPLSYAARPTHTG